VHLKKGYVGGQKEGCTRLHDFSGTGKEKKKGREGGKITYLPTYKTGGGGWGGVEL